LLGLLRIFIKNISKYITMVYHFIKYIRLGGTLENKFNYDWKPALISWNKVLYLNVNIIHDYVKCDINIL